MDSYRYLLAAQKWFELGSEVSMWEALLMREQARHELDEALWGMLA